jgi:serpin B
MKKLSSIILVFFALATLPSVKAQQNSSDVINGMNNFACNVYRELNQTNQNMVFSPYSVSFLLELLVSGSANNTRSQLINLLHLTDDNSLNNLNAFLDQIDTDLTGKNHGLSLANALWSDKTLSYHPDFLADMNKLHNKSFYQVDFAHDPDSARLSINKWAETNTSGYIKNLLEKGTITNLTKLVLTNAIYFKGEWATPFDKTNTRPGTFTTSDNKTIQVPMMHITSNFYYNEDDQMQMLSMNYKQSSLAMAIILPKDIHNLQKIQQSLNAKSFSPAHNMDKKIIVTMPKFKIDSTLASILVNALQKLGLKDAFIPAKADFKKMADPDPAHPLYIDNIIQKAMIEVDEAGTVAAASTVIIMSARAVVLSTDNTPKIVFAADHPFLFIIYDTESKLILFVGHVTKP